MLAVFPIEQAIFGYKDGHRLLQASRTFTSAAERVLLSLSDMSGPRMVSGFEEYVSAYPVPDDDCYAITKTWYAAEMRRPGCVWTHALILRNVDLVHVRAMSGLLRLFRRPEGSIEGYNTRLEVSERETLQDLALAPLPEAAESLIALLYGVPTASVILGASDSRTFEQLVCSIWSQQWPELRANFYMCTGALAPRTHGGRPFDLQVVPQRVERELKRSADTFVFLNLDEPVAREPRSPFQRGAVDLVAGGGNLREFLWRYSEGCGDRGLYLPLIRLYTGLLTGTYNISEAVGEVCELFPAPHEGASLKYDLFGPIDSRDFSGLPRFTEVEVLSGLATCRHSEAFDTSKLDLRSRAADLWRSNQEAASHLLTEMLNRNQREFSEEIMAGFAEAMSAQQVCRLASERPALLAAFVKRNLRLASQTEFWSCPVAPQTLYDVLDILQKSKSDFGITEWIRAAVVSGPAVIAPATFERFGGDAATAFLDWFNREADSGWIVPEAWQDALLSRQDDVLNWLRRTLPHCRPETLALAAATLSPHSPGVASLGMSPWVTLVEHSRLLGQYRRAQPAAFLLTLGLRNGSPEGRKLVMTTFETVHETAAREQLDYRAWQFLNEVLPPIRWGREWDKCERLRRALVAWLRDWPMPAVEFLDAVRNPSLFRKLLESAEEVHLGEGFFRHVANQVADQTVIATEAQRRALDDAFPRTTWGRLKREFL